MLCSALRFFARLEFGRQDQDASNGRNEPDKQKRLRKECVLPKGHLNRVKQLDDEQDQQNPIKQLDSNDIRTGPLGRQVMSKLNATVYQKYERTGGEEQSETDVDNILNRGEGTSDPCAGWRST